MIQPNIPRLRHQVVTGVKTEFTGTVQHHDQLSKFQPGPECPPTHFHDHLMAPDMCY